MRSRRSEGIGLLVALAVCLGTGALGALITTPEIDGWYRSVAKPAWTPPDWVFGPVWTTLYVLMAIAVWLVWVRRRPGESIFPIGTFGLQLALNLGWSWLFFGLHRPGWASAEILVLLAAIVETALQFRRSSSAAAWLLVPYMAWVSFAAALNISIWRLNV